MLFHNRNIWLVILRLFLLIITSYKLLRCNSPQRTTFFFAFSIKLTAFESSPFWHVNSSICYVKVERQALKRSPIHTHYCPMNSSITSPNPQTIAQVFATKSETSQTFLLPRKHSMVVHLKVTSELVSCCCYLNHTRVHGGQPSTSLSWLLGSIIISLLSSLHTCPMTDIKIWFF